ncbi:MAG: UvrD-helicase domain-containing protein [Pseudomonadota bacterium]|jgi:mRNA-degrading endonuclease RelE of RelBE toxin-antitoxin system|nr:UvrD-helicase domain-containing protein [Pseudomonadota bacterium]
MQFRISDTFTESLAKLTGDEQKAVKTTAFDLQINPANPGMRFHRLDGARDPNFWSVRVNRDVRLIVHRSADSLLLCYVDHHDKAYTWAERRKLETHPKTGAAQLVELRERVQEIVTPVFQAAPATPVASTTPSKPKLFDQRSDDELLGYGIPPEWLADVRVADEDSLLVLAEHLPGEAAEALLELATGGTPRRPAAPSPAASPFEHPDAQRRFRVMTNVEELTRALDYPWDRWSVFLHPEQQQIVERDFNGPARISGSAGTGKTIVALHRAVHLARTHSDSRVLLATFSEPLAHALQIKLRRLVSHEPRLAERIDVDALDTVAIRLHKSLIGPVTLVPESMLRTIVQESSAAAPAHRFSPSFLRSEWTHIVDARQLRTWEAYRDVPRLGRKTRLKEPQRAQLWEIFARVWSTLGERKLTTLAGAYVALTGRLAAERNPPYDFAVIDECQDLSVAQLDFLAALGGDRSNALFFAGDLGQRIFQQPFSWFSQGVDVRGRSRTLRVNYRTSHQIRQQADRLLDPELTDMDGLREERRDTVSVFNGPVPQVRSFATEDEEVKAVAAWLRERTTEGVEPHEIGVFVRSEAQIGRATRAMREAGIACRELNTQVEVTGGFAAIGVMHLAKGLEFLAVAVMACDDEVLPLQERIEQIGEDGDLQDAYDSERHLLYVACTRARDQLHVSGVEPVSEFLEDFSASVGNHE